MAKQIRLLAVLLFIAAHCSASPQDIASNVNEHHFLTTGGSVKVLLANTSSSVEPVSVDYLSADGLVLRTDYEPLLLPSDTRQFSAVTAPAGTSEIVVRASTTVRVSVASAHLQSAGAQAIITGSLWQSLSGPWAASCNGTFGAILVAPNDPKTIYIGSSDLSNGCGVFKSTDGGLSWTAQNDGISQVGLFSKHFLPVTTFAPTKDPSVMYMGTNGPLGGGVYKTTNAGAHWSLAGGTVNFFGNAEVSNAISIAADPNDPNTVYAGLLSNGVFKSTNAGQHWQQIRPGGPSDVFHIVRFVDNQTLLTAGGTTFDSAPCFPLPNLDSLDCSGVLPLGPALTTDGGSHWNYLTYPGGYPANSIFFSALESVQVNGAWTSFAATIGAGILVGPFPALIAPKGVFKVSSGGGAWMKTTGVDSSGKDYPVTGLTIDVKDPAKIFTYIPGKAIFESPDGGSHWTPIDFPLGASTINKLQAGGNRLYALTDRGLFIYDYTPGFSTGVNGSSRVITQGENTSFTVTVISQGNFNSPVSVSVINLPSGCTSSPATVTPPANGQASSTLNISTTSSTSAGTFTVTLRAVATGYPTKDIPVTMTINPAVPTPAVTSVSPNPVTGSNSPQTFTVNGTGFTSSSTVTLRLLLSGGGQTFTNVPIASRTATQLVLNPTFGTTASQWSAQVINGSLSSSQFTFQVNSPIVAPAVTSVSPNPVTGSNSPQTFNVNGTGFTSSSTVTLRLLLSGGGQTFTNVPIASRTATQLVLNPTFGTTASQWSAQVINGSLSSSQFTFQVNSPIVAPAVTSVSPNPVTGSNSPQTFNVNGTGFTSSSTVTLGTAYNTYPNVSIISRNSTQMVVSATFGTTAAMWWVKVIDSSRVSNQYSFSVQAPAVPIPSISSINPNPVPRGSAVTVDIYGSNFQSGGTLHFTWTVSGGGSRDRTDYTFYDPTHLRIVINSGTVAGSGWAVQMINPGGRSSNALAFVTH